MIFIVYSELTLTKQSSGTDTPALTFLNPLRISQRMTTSVAAVHREDSRHQWNP